MQFAPIMMYVLSGLLMIIVLRKILKRPVKVTNKESQPTVVYRSTFGSWTCDHGPFGSPRFVRVKDKQVGVSVSMFCPDCTQKYFEKYATFCDKCGEVIAPGMPVGQHYEKDANGVEKLLTVCQGWNCCIGGDLCGIWGEGKINHAPWGNPEVRRAMSAVIPVAIQENAQETVSETVVESVTEVASLQSPEGNPPPVQEA